MSEKKRFEFYSDDYLVGIIDTATGKKLNHFATIDLLNEQQELIEELQASDEMGWKRAEMFEKKCPKELHNQKMYIKRLEYKVQKFKEENEQLKRQNIQSKREESLNLKDYVETDERGHIVKVKLVDYIDDLIYERLNKKLED